jgi:hypothetical protein
MSRSTRRQLQRVQRAGAIGVGERSISTEEALRPGQRCSRHRADAAVDAGQPFAAYVDSPIPWVLAAAVGSLPPPQRAVASDIPVRPPGARDIAAADDRAAGERPRSSS